MNQQIKLHAYSLRPDESIILDLHQFEDEVNALLTNGWTISGPSFMVTKEGYPPAIIQPLFRLIKQ